MNNNKSSSRVVAVFLVGTFLFGSIYTAIGATGDVPVWMGDTDEIINANKDYVFPTPAERAAQKALADAAVKAAAEEAVADAAVKAAAEEAVADAAAKAVAKAAAEEAVADAAAKAAAKAAEEADAAAKAVVEESTGQQSSEDAVVAEEAQKLVEEVAKAVGEKAADAAEDAAIEQAIEESKSDYTDEEKGAVKEGVASALAEELDKTDGESVRVYLGNGKWGEVDKDNLDGFNRLAGLYSGSDKFGHDLNNNGIDDSIEAETGTVSFDEDKKAAVEDEIVYGITEKESEKPVLVAAPAKDKEKPQVLGNEPLFKLKNPKKISGQKVVIELKDEVGNVVESITVYTDENGVAVYKPLANLKNGKYSMSAVDAVDADGNVLAINDFEVDSGKVPAAPRLTFGDELSMDPAEDDVASLNYGQASVLGADVLSTNSFDITKYLIKAYIYKFLPYLDPRNEDIFAAAGINVIQEEKPKVLYGSAQPGTKVFITWKSIVRSSVVIADANGKFKVEDPVGPGNHEVFAFAYDPKNNFVGNVSSIFFKK
ncbi:hypothetical protein COY05_00375 [Candidatus Peregrinibacteria bacterium CG_4_10_14_0_2_um_filter_38_24]|nr:MAG: hypothetical protein COY05_00375 [Candidatus Peregrinibacteria bacterium CG_4_10_14_0_2_um_filter_38_24]